MQSTQRFRQVWAAHLVSHNRASPLEATEIGQREPEQSREVGGDVDEHLLWKLGEGSRRRHRPPGDERRVKEVLVGVVGDNGDGKRASAQWQRDERTGFGVVPLCSNQRGTRMATLGTAVV